MVFVIGRKSLRQRLIQELIVVHHASSVAFQRLVMPLRSNPTRTSYGGR